MKEKDIVAMQTLPRPQTPPHLSGPLPRPRRRKRFSPLMLIGIAVTLLAIVGAGVFLVTRPHGGSHAAGVNMDCSLIVPANPLTAKGLATPYQLMATNPANGPCNEANANQSAFVQAVVINPASGKVMVYNPLVVDQNTQAAIAPVTPKLPQNGIVALWFGFNGNNLTLQGTNGSLNQGKCVNGLPNSIFGQYAYCNAPAFYQAANQAIQARKLVVPPLGMGKDGQLCPTVRSFSVVDMDQSDNLPVKYLANANGQIAQLTAKNAAKLQNATTLGNPSDNGLVDNVLDGALGCIPWTVTDLADPGQAVPAYPLNELQAAAMQPAPVAMIPVGDPMVLNNNQTSLRKTNLYRAGADQALAQNMNAASTQTYCQNILSMAPTRLNLDKQFTNAVPSPDAVAATTLFNFLANRLMTTLGPNGLNCTGLLNVQNPVMVQTDGNGVVTSATINTTPVQGGGGGNTPNCVVNGTALAGCTGTTTIGNQSCTFAVNANNNQVTINCANAQAGGQQQGGQNGQPTGNQAGGQQGGQTTMTPTGN